MSEYTTVADVRDLDRIFLATIAGCDYYELRQIVRSDGQKQQTIGLASAWPLISRDARLAELAQLLTASEARSVEADCHVSELISRVSAYQEHIAALEAALADLSKPETITPPEAETAEQAFLASIALCEAPDDGKIPCDHPGCDARVKPRGLLNHKRLAHGATLAEPAATPAHIVEALELPEPPWACAECHEATHARSLKDPALCIRCVVAHTDGALTNGHRVAA